MLLGKKNSSFKLLEMSAKTSNLIFCKGSAINFQEHAFEVLRANVYKETRRRAC